MILKSLILRLVENVRTTHKSLRDVMKDQISLCNLALDAVDSIS